MTSIKLFRGEFGHVSVLSAASDLVTHAHPEVHLIVWLDGDPGTMTVGDTLVELGPDVAVAVNSMQPHSHSFRRDGAPGSFLAFYIHPQWALGRHGRRANEVLFRHAAIPLTQALRDRVDDLFGHLAVAYDYGDLAFYENERMVSELIDTLIDAQPPEEGAIHPGGRIDRRIRKSIELMRANVTSRLGLDEVARSVGLSRPHFFALFKEQMQLTPNVYWNTLRMEEALRQLEVTEDSLTSVAYNLGFSSQGNFTRFFRDHAGVPPTLYREASRGAAPDEFSDFTITGETH